MKRIIGFIVCILLFFTLSSSVFADEKVGEIFASDMGALIDFQPIRPYVMNENIYIEVEDLKGYCFDVVFEQNNNVIQINYNSAAERSYNSI